jgi:hypothetical protein
MLAAIAIVVVSVIILDLRFDHVGCHCTGNSADYLAQPAAT